MHDTFTTMLKKLALFVGFCSACLSAQDDWKPFAFLIGTWEAKALGGSAGASASGTYSFQPELLGHILARHSTNANCKGPDAYDCAHTDLLYV
jgi:hypothetical protein